MVNICWRQIHEGVHTLGSIDHHVILLNGVTFTVPCMWNAGIVVAARLQLVPKVISPANFSDTIFQGQEDNRDDVGLLWDTHDTTLVWLQSVNSNTLLVAREEMCVLLISVVFHVIGHVTGARVNNIE